MFLIGLTGGIAAGKSTVAQEFARLGAIVLDADQIARDVLSPESPTLARIVGLFGSGVLRADQSLNRDMLGEIVFSDSDKLAALNAIVHPAVKSHTRELLQQIEQCTPDAVVVYDVPLLIEANVDHKWNMIIVAMASEEERISRLTSLRGLSREEALSRIDKQATDEQRIQVADEIIDTGGTLDETRAQTLAIWQRVQQMSGSTA